MTANKYVFREQGGRLRFVGDFDGLYRTETDPWGQSAKTGPMAPYYIASRRRLCGALRRHAGRVRLGLEVGCGNGWVLKQLRNEVGGVWDGLDVSPLAVTHAGVKNPSSTIYCQDIACYMPMPPNMLGRYDVVILSQLLWYVLTRIDVAVMNATRVTKVGGLVVVSQAFLRGRQRYGLKIADGWRGTVALFLKRYPMLELVEAQYDASELRTHHDGLLVFRKTANAQ
jgi:SAM-dependent methyltransferase